MSHLPQIPGNAGIADRARAILGPDLIEATEVVGELTLVVNREAAGSVLQQLRDTPDLAYEQLLDIAGADYPERAERLEVKNAKVMWPVRIAVSGRAVTPGGAVEICRILGREETLRRIDAGIAKLEG